MFPPDQTAHAAISIETDDRNLAVVGREPGRFNVEIKRPRPERSKQPPVVARMKAAGKVPGIAAVEVILRRSEVGIIQGFAGRRDPSEAKTVDERLSNWKCPPPTAVVRWKNRYLSDGRTLRST